MLPENRPRWWHYDLELSPHVLDRMTDRGFSEADLRIMMENVVRLNQGSRPGRWNLETTHLGDPWEVVVEPDEHERLIVVITAYKVNT